MVLDHILGKRDSVADPKNAVFFGRFSVNFNLQFDRAEGKTSIAFKLRASKVKSRSPF